MRLGCCLGPGSSRAGQLRVELRLHQPADALRQRRQEHAHFFAQRQLRERCTSAALVQHPAWEGLPLGRTAQILFEARRPRGVRAREIRRELVELRHCEQHLTRTQFGRCVGRGEPSPGADVAGVSPVPVQMWQGRAQSRRRCGRGEPSPGADVWTGVSPVPVQMCGQGRAQSRCRCDETRTWPMHVTGRMPCAGSRRTFRSASTAIAKTSSLHAWPVSMPRRACRVCEGAPVRACVRAEHRWRVRVRVHSGYSSQQCRQ